MKNFKALLLASVIFLCACGSADNLKTAEAKNKGVSSVKYSSLDTPIKIEIGNTDNQSDKVIRAGSSNVYRRSNIEASANENSAQADNTNTNEPAPLTSSERAKRLSRSIINIKGIEKASVAISGHTAIIGIEYTGHLDGMLLMKLKKEVDEIAKATDKGINNVAVTATTELVTRVTKMSNAEISSKNDLEYNEDIADTFLNLMPALYR